MLDLIQNPITAISNKNTKNVALYYSHFNRKDIVTTQVKNHHLRKQNIAIYKVLTSQSRWASFVELGRHVTLIFPIMSKKCQENPSWENIHGNAMLQE